MEENEMFLELLDSYLDMEEINNKRNSDFEETKDKHGNTSSPFNIEDTISIGKFVNDYLHIEGDCRNLYHSGLKELECKYVMGVANDFANKNPELVYQGYLLVVLDARHNRGTYVNPLYLEKLLEKRSLEREFKVFNRKRINDFNMLKEYCRRYVELSNQIELNEKFYKILEETHKVGKYKKLLKERKDNND